MSSISFPDSQSSSRPSDDQFYSSPFDPSSSFHMNPLSSHPPRTPRTSIISHSPHSYNPTVYESNEEIEEKVDAESVELDEEGDKVQAAEKRILKEEVWREMFLTSDGRDKAFASSFAILRLPYAYSLT